jgi:hypothetical protein
MTQALTYEEVVLAGRKAYEEKRLSAQGPTPQCAYRDNSGCPCVVGAALPDSTIAVINQKFMQGSRVSQLRSADVISVKSIDELDAIGDLQNAHDEWAKALVALESSLDDPITRKRLKQVADECEAIFVRLLYR